MSTGKVESRHGERRIGCSIMLQRLSCVFFSGDLIRWMQNSNILPGNQDTSRNISFGAFTLACALQCIFWIKKATDKPASGSNGDGGKGRAMAFRNALFML